MNNSRLIPNGSFRRKIIVLFFCLILAPFLFFSYYSYHQSTKGISDASESFYIAYFMQNRKNFDAYLDGLNNSINDIIGTKQLQQLLDTKPQTPEEDSNVAVEMASFIYQKQLLLGSAGAFRLRIYPVHLEDYPTFTKNLDDGSGLAEQAWFRDEISHGKPTWRLFLPQDNPSFYPTPLITRMKQFTGLYDNEPRGIIAVDILEDQMYRFVTPPQSLKGQESFILNDEGRVLSHTKKELIGSNINSAALLNVIKQHNEGTEIINLGNSQSLITYARLTDEPWVMVSSIPLATLMSPIQEITKLTVVFVVAYIVSCVGVIIYITLHFTNPIMRLVRSMRKLEQGDFQTTLVQTNRQDEIGWLYNGYIQMTQKIQQLLQEVYVSEQVKKELEFQVLSHQINPHFLYNTLESIRWKAESHHMADISEMVASLGNLLRLSLNQGKELTTVRRELDHLKAYTHIESARLDRPLRVVVLVDEGLMELPVLRLLLQPLVENAIHHGIRDQLDKGKIVLTGKCDGGQLIFELSDNGKGIPEQVLQQIHDGRIGEERSGTRQGVGLWNVHQRLKLYFGEEYGLSIVSAPMEGTHITIRHPILQQDTEIK
ncbi:sensor histidine kinase [Paenibacillus sp. WQ 127069]|uniref:histidine kinase n=1 Tax=Paenibacillus baimaensis TaxID=2982185 RepID=A0ABT2ULN6_9BACL|nr:sensor histidine kinase [Paenibacillus sp. WQ 127069]MCU6795544.1 sensor histidine kinase [Paenibacillus sp. WQ 127069]